MSHQSMSSGKLILAINAGSSSVKLSLYSSPTPDSKAGEASIPKLILTSSISNLTSPPAIFKYTHAPGSCSPSNVDSTEVPDIKSQEDAFKYFLNCLLGDSELKQVRSGDDIAFACHRIVHGGDYEKPVLLGQRSLDHLKKLTDLAPLHNAPALSLVRTTLKQLPKTKNIAFFDTTFHTISLPEHIRTYPLDPEHARRHRIRKYGFHGISYSYILREVAAYLNKPIEETNIIALHLGSGASACVIQNGRSIDTSMGLTPLEGLPGATRSGTVDPSLVFHYTTHASQLSHPPNDDDDPRITRACPPFPVSLILTNHTLQAEEILNKHSGWAALTGTSDFAALNSAWPPPNAALTFALFVDRVLNFVGAYFVKLRGQVDALVFAGGVGERSVELRAAILDAVACLGFEIRRRDNEMVDWKEGAVVGIGGGSPEVLVCRTDEAHEMARECAAEKRFWGDL